MEFNEREVAAILAALRLAQRDKHWQEFISMRHFADVTPPTDEEMDDLCEYVNTGKRS